MKSARESAAYLRQHPAAATIQRQAAETSRSQRIPGDREVSQGSLRQRAAMKAHVQQGGSLPDAAAAAASISSAAARRTNTSAPATTA